MQTLAIKRNRMQVLTEILQTCKSPQIKTRIMQKANLSYVSLQDCLSHLQELGFIQPYGNTKFLTTEKGAIFLGKWMQLQELLKPRERVSIIRETRSSRKQHSLSFT
jgi:predicted transcriptional regulator